jgi:glycerate-2-kinase
MALRSRARQLGLDPNRALANDGGYHDKTAPGDLLQTGPTPTDLNALLSRIIFLGARPPGAEIESS